MLGTRVVDRAPVVVGEGPSYGPWDVTFTTSMGVAVDGAGEVIVVWALEAKGTATAPPRRAVSPRAVLATIVACLASL